MRFPSASTIRRRISICFISCASATRTRYRCSTAWRANIGQARKRSVTLEQALARYQQGGARNFPPSWPAVEDYAEFHWQHMKAEEDEVLPLARKHLTADDWDAIDAAFSGHTDPMLGIDVGAGFAALFSRIVLLAPPPIGVGPGAATNLIAQACLGLTGPHRRASARHSRAVAVAIRSIELADRDRSRVRSRGRPTVCPLTRRGTVLLVLAITSSSLARPARAGGGGRSTTSPSA